MDILSKSGITHLHVIGRKFNHITSMMTVLRSDQMIFVLIVKITAFMQKTVLLVIGSFDLVYKVFGNII